MACVEIKRSHKRWLLWAFISTAMYLSICRYDDQAFDDINEENEKKKKNFIVKKSLQPVPNQGIVEQAKKM